MKRNLWTILGVALLFGIAGGAYEFALPFYMKAHHMSYVEMGIIYALSGLAMVGVRIYMGGLSDRWGRKRLYGWAIAVCGAATAVGAYLPGFLWQTLLKTVRDTAALTRETIHPIVLYEERTEGFLNRIGKFRGMEYLMVAVGTLVAGYIVKRMGDHGAAPYQLTLVIAGALLVIGAGWWALRFHEHWVSTAQQVISLRELVHLDLHPNLLALVVSGFIFTFGMQLSHSIYLALFFKEQFHASPSTVALIMVGHRLTIALPLLVVGNLPLKNLKRWYIIGMLIEGASVVVTPLLPWLGWSVGVFLLHDLVGAGIWSPIQATLIQRYSRPERRGMEVGKVLAWSSLGGVLGPLAAGFLATQSTILPYLFSGIFMLLSAIPLCYLNLRAPEPIAPPAKQVAEAVG